MREVEEITVGVSPSDWDFEAVAMTAVETWSTTTLSAPFGFARYLAERTEDGSTPTLRLVAWS